MKKSTAGQWLKNPNNLAYLESTAPNEEQMAQHALETDLECEAIERDEKRLGQCSKWINAACIMAYLPEDKLLQKLLTQPMAPRVYGPGIGGIYDRNKLNDKRPLFDAQETLLPFSPMRALHDSFNQDEMNSLYDAILNLESQHGLAYDVVYLTKIMAIARVALEYTREDLSAILATPEKIDEFVATALQRINIEVPDRLGCLRNKMPRVDRHNRTANEALYQVLCCRDSKRRTLTECCDYLEVDPKTVRGALKKLQASGEPVSLFSESGFRRIDSDTKL